ncbi:hypothetical protein K7432_005497 [Basidiobolus ranarum]|uniref:F-box domain-containing protein n=1 Tax=Basidiobolus ranarum TaxID=34480 RepID=A0ABR2W310_9FUNG
MSVQLPTPCLRQIFQWLKFDKDTCYKLCFVNRLWSEASVLYLYRDPWALLANEKFSQTQRKLAITKLLRTYLSCLEYDSFDSEELDAVTTIDALCSDIGYLDRFYLLIQNFFNQMNPILDDLELQVAVEAFEAIHYSALNRPFYDYLYLARTFDLVALQDFLRLVKADPFPFLSFEYTSEEVLVDQRLALKLWSVTRSRCAPCITSLTLNAIIPLKEIFPEPLSFYSLTHLKILWKQDQMPNQLPDNHLKFIATSCHNLEVLHLTAESRLTPILDKDIAEVIRNQRPGSLRELKISGVSDLLTETLEALLEQHRGSLTSLKISKNDSGRIPLTKITSFPNLKTLELVDCFVRDRDIEYIASHGAPLKKIVLRKLHQVTWRGIRNLIQKSGLNLRKLVVHEIQEHTIDSETVAVIAQNCQNLQHFQIEMIRIDNFDLAGLLGRCHKLKYLSFGELSSNLPSDGDQLVNVILDNCPLLKYLYAPEMVTTESALQALLQHRQLEKISLPTILL